MQAQVAVAKITARPYVAPFAVFMVLLALQPHLDLTERPLLLLWLVVLTATLWIWSRPVIGLRTRQAAASVLIGGFTFAIWILPDVLFPHYRASWLFQNPLTGSLASSIPPQDRLDATVLLLRSIRAVVLVPIVEELFWRAWLMRWLISHDFESVPLGAYQPAAFWITAVLFATEHGPYWDVGLLAGILYNWWMVRTRSLGDCILAHAVTNACLCAYVIATHRWEYWM